MKILKEPFDNLLAIEILEHSKGFSFYKKDYELGYVFRWIDDIINVIDFENEYKVLGCVTPTEIDFDCSSIFIVSTSAVTKKDYKIYLNEQSLRSLLSYNGIEIKDGYKLVILEKQ